MLPFARRRSSDASTTAFSAHVDKESSGYYRPTTRVVMSIFAILLVLSWICIAVLFYLYSTVAHTTGDRSAVTLTLPTLGLASSASSTSLFAIGPQKAVSLSSIGQAQLGAGKSIFKGIASMQTTCPKYIDMGAVFDHSYITAYQNVGSGFTVFKVVTLDALNQVSSIVATPSTSAQFYKMVSLNKASGLILGIAQSVASQSSYVTAGNVDSTSKVVQLGTPALYGCYADVGTFDPRITRVSDTTFAISAFCSDANYQSSMVTQFGSVDPVTLNVQLGPLLQYADKSFGSDGNAHHNIVGLDDTNYLVVFANSTVPLRAVKVTADVSTLQLNKSAVYELSDAKMAKIQFFDVTRIDNNTAMVAYVDDNTEGGLTTVLIDATSKDRSALRFGNSLSISHGSQVGKFNEYFASYATVPDWVEYDLSMDFSLTSVGSNGALLMYSDVANGAKWTVALIEIGKGNTLVPSSPHFVLNKDSTIGFDSGDVQTDNGNVHTFVYDRFEAVAVASSASRVALFSTISHDDCSTVATSDFSVLEIRSPAAGISMGASSSNGIPVQISGTVSGLSGLQPGMMYFSDTRGNLIPSSYAYGTTSALLALSDYIETDSVIVTLDSQVGIATSDSTLYLTK